MNRTKQHGVKVRPGPRDQGLWSPESRTQDSSSRCKSKIQESPKSVKVGPFWKRKHKNNITGIKRLGPWFWGPGIPPPGILAPLLHHAEKSLIPFLYKVTLSLMAYVKRMKIIYIMLLCNIM